MKTGKLSGLIFIVILFLIMLLTGCDCKSDDGVITFNEDANVVSMITAVVLIIVALIMGIASKNKDEVLSVSSFIIMIAGILLLTLSTWRQSQIAATTNHMFEKQYIYKQVNDSTFVITDSIYIYK